MSYQPRYPSFVALLQSAEQRFSNRPLFGTRKSHGWHYITYSEFGELVAAMRGGLASLGLVPGDRVAVISDNRVEWAVGSFGTLTFGAAYVPMYQAQKDQEYRYILRDAGAKVCLCANDQIRDRVRALSSDLPDLSHIISFESPEYTALLDAGRQHPAPVLQPKDDDLAFLIYTSGTTGDPKGVELTHLNLGATGSGIIEIAPLTEDYELTVSFLPWAHVFGGCVEVSCVMGYGGALAICDNTEKLLEYLAEVKPSALFAVPRIWNRIYESVNKQINERPPVVQKVLRAGLAARTKQLKGQSLSIVDRVALLLTDKLLVSKVKQRFGGRVRFAVSGAAGLAQEVAEFINAIGITALEGYGLTETTAGGTGSKPHERRVGSVGKALPGMRIEIDKTAVTTGEDGGEIILHGPCVMRGYHNLPEQTTAAFTADGGLRTGDLGYVDGDGYLFITGRVKELYKLSNGKYVAPAALEEKLQLSPYIAQSFVYGSDQPHNTAVIIADVPSLQAYCEKQGVRAAGSTTDLLKQPQVRELIRTEIDNQSRSWKGYEKVKDFILDAEPFTTQNDMLTQTLKLKRRNVLIKYKTLIDALYR